MRKERLPQAITNYSPLWAGQAVALAREEDAGQLTGRLWSEAKATLAALRLTP